MINQLGEVVTTYEEYAEKIESAMNYSVAAVRALKKSIGSCCSERSAPLVNP